MDIITPLVHLNGTSRQTLIDQYREAIEAINEAVAKLNRAYPHMRDFYPKKDADTSYRKACVEHERRVVALTAVKRELEQLWEEVDGQGRPKDL